MSEVLYTSSATAFGGIEGKVQSEDHTIDMETVLPGSQKDEDSYEATNPEQLFAAAYASCFDSALQIAADQAQVEFESEVTVNVSLLKDEEDGYQLAVDLQVKGYNIDQEQLQQLVEKANRIWPYSDDKRTNMDFSIDVHSVGS
ncbi:Ohr family peroxiredoxin [Lysinibacillus yapensis]|uniref:Ohr family peroxiredoxin n=1 Tax=Ureibacillus yapensis TaxID=2304605 RepID=A0A396S6D7_9BACL|nr:Ohr family peroxiredoxin [Lysinibacillus yapensis]RHW35881.1 Ohr family peroxiredoxin [Lysinibacillus yapensis]